MNTPSKSTRYSRYSILIAGTLLMSHGAAAGDRSGDAQAQAAQLMLLQVTPAHPARTMARASRTARISAQDSARAMLLGKP